MGPAGTTAWPHFPGESDNVWPISVRSQNSSQISLSSSHHSMDLNDIPIINDPKHSTSTLRDVSDVPVLDEAVRVELRKLGEPITYFGEDKADRRARLIKLIQEKPNYNIDYAINSGEGNSSEEESEEEDDEEEFYTPGTEELHQARVKILDYSLEKAQTRLKLQKQAFQKQDFVKNLRHRRNINSELAKFELYGSQLIPGNTRAISSVRYNGDSSLVAAGSWDGQVYVVESLELQLVCKLNNNGHSEKVGMLDWHGEYLVSGGNEGSINVWKPTRTDASMVPVASIKSAHSNRITKTIFHPSGQYIVSTSFDQTWKLWDITRLESPVELVEQEGHSKEVFTAAFHPDGSLVVTGGLDGIGRVWDLRSGRSIAILEGHSKGIYGVDWSDNGYHIATASGDSSVNIWDLRSFSAARQQLALFAIPAHKKLVSDVRFLHKKLANSRLVKPVTDENDENPEILDYNGSVLITSSYDNTVNVWSADNWIKIKSLEGHSDRVMSCDISGDGTGIVSSGWDRTIKLWSV